MEIITITIEGAQGSGKSQLAGAIKELLETKRMPYKQSTYNVIVNDGEEFKPTLIIDVIQG